MTSKLIAALSLSGALFIAACASTMQFPGAASPGTPGGTVKGIGGTVGSFFRSSLWPLGVSKEVVIFSVNGTKVNGMGATSFVRLAPGTQHVEVSCSFNIDGQLIQGHGNVTVEIVDGHTYQLDAKPPCIASVIDVTPG